jgi:hypothetical protein
MKKSHLLGAVCAVLFSLITVSVNATLHGRLPLTPGGTDYQAAYDDVLDITWVTDGDLSGLGNWQTQVDWAANLDYLGFDDWRLPSMSVSAGLPTGTATSVIDCSIATELDCRENELGYMYSYNLTPSGDTPPTDIYTNLGGDQTVGDITFSSICDPPPHGAYPTVCWSGTGLDSDSAWFLGFDSGTQFNIVKEWNGAFGWAVRDGDVLVPHTLVDNGDTTIDTTSGLEWLDLTLTQGVSALAVLNGFGGYIEAGWTFATVEQVCGLFGALLDDTTNCTTGTVAMLMDPTNAERLVSLLGNTAASGRGAYGMFSNLGGAPGNFSLGCLNDTATSCTGGGSQLLAHPDWMGEHL